MRRSVGLIVLGIGLAATIWVVGLGRQTSREIDRLSAALDADLVAWAAEAPSRPMLFGEAIPGDALGLYDEAFAPIVNQRQPQGGHLYELGKQPDQFNLRAVLGTICRAARSETGPVPGVRWDGRPFMCRSWAFRQLGMQVRSDAVWGETARLTSGDETPPSDGPELMFLVEHILGLLRMQDDLSRSVAGVCRTCLAEEVFFAVLKGVAGPLESGSWTVREAEALDRGLVAYLRSMPSPEECRREASLALQMQFRAALRGEWPTEDYDWGRAANKFLGTRGRILAAWRACRAGADRGEPHEDPVLHLAFAGHGPLSAASGQRWYRRRYEQLLLGLRAFLFHEAQNRYPETVAALLAAGGAREQPDTGHWEISTPEHGYEWEIGWIDPDGEPDWKLRLRCEN